MVKTFIFNGVTVQTSEIQLVCLRSFQCQLSSLSSKIVCTAESQKVFSVDVRQSNCWHHHFSQLVCVQSVSCQGSTSLSPHLVFARLCPKKKHIMLLAVLILFRNYAKIMLLSENYALCHRNYATQILRKIKITCCSTLAILTLMNIHIVHHPV